MIIMTMPMIAMITMMINWPGNQWFNSLIIVEYLSLSMRFNCDEILNDRIDVLMIIIIMAMPMIAMITMMINRPGNQWFNSLNIVEYLSLFRARRFVSSSLYFYQLLLLFFLTK